MDLSVVATQCGRQRYIAFSLHEAVFIILIRTTSMSLSEWDGALEH